MALALRVVSPPNRFESSPEIFIDLLQGLIEGLPLVPPIT